MRTEGICVHKGKNTAYSANSLEHISAIFTAFERKMHVVTASAGHIPVPDAGLQIQFNHAYHSARKNNLKAKEVCKIPKSCSKPILCC